MVLTSTWQHAIGCGSRVGQSRVAVSKSVFSFIWFSLDGDGDGETSRQLVRWFLSRRRNLSVRSLETDLFSHPNFSVVSNLNGMCSSSVMSLIFFFPLWDIEDVLVIVDLRTPHRLHVNLRSSSCYCQIAC